MTETDLSNPNPIRIGDTVLLPSKFNDNNHYVVVDTVWGFQPIEPIWAITIVRKHPDRVSTSKRVFWVKDGDDATDALGDHTIMGRRLYGTGHSRLEPVPSYTLNTEDRLPWEIDSYGISLGFMKDGHSLLCEDCARQAYVEEWGCVEAVDVTTVHRQECDESCGKWIGEAVYYDELGLGHLVDEDDQLEDGDVLVADNG